MFLKWIITGTAAFFLASTAISQTAKINPAGSQLEWTGSKVIGSKHVGNIKVKSGEVTYKNKLPTAATLVVDMTTITNTDLTDPKWNAKLVGHLNSDDFFSTAKHNEAKIVTTKFQAQGKGKYTVTGNLTIKGITKPVTFTAEVKEQAGKVAKIVANLEFDRTLYDIRYGSGKFFDNLGDKMISDKVQLKADLILQSQIQLGQN